MPMFTIFLILLVAIFAIVVYFTEPSETDTRVRERLMEVGRRSGQVQEEEVALLRQVQYSQIKFFDRYLRESKFAEKLHGYLEQAQVPWTVGRFVFFSALLLLIGAMVGNWRIPHSPMGWVPGMLLGALPSLFVYYKRQKRFRAFEALLPEAIDLMARVLKAGQALSAALLTVGDELPDPLGAEFRRTADELSFGLPFREAMLNMSRRFPIGELRFLVSAIVIQKDTGGNLVELLEKSAALLRARVVLRQKIRVFSAQGRLTGVILVALPFLCFLVLNYIRPSYAQPMFDSETGRTWLYVTGADMMVGVFFIRRIVNMKV